MMDFIGLLIMSVITTLVIPMCSSGAASGSRRKFENSPFPSSSSSYSSQYHNQYPHQVLLDPVRMCRNKNRRTNNNNLKDSSNFIVHGNTVGGGIGLVGGGGGRNGRHRRKVRSFCTKEPEIIREATRGAQIATAECQFQFRNRRWNCSSHPKSIRRILDRDTRETAFVHAITSAGVTYTVTQACSSGQIQDCPCDRTLNGKSADGTWEWGGCGDNVFIGYERSKDILDIKYRRRSDIRSLLLLHNNEAGRMAVRNNMRLVCKCHGLSGSCTTKTCWQKVPPFREIGEMLKVKFDGAAKVIPGNDGKSIIPWMPTIKPPEKDDLVYFDESQDFCRLDRKSGSQGTTGRQCNVTSLGVDGCDLLCCGRGYTRREVKVKEYCRCKFQWCCDVHCDTCIKRKVIYTCR